MCTCFPVSPSFLFAFWKRTAPSGWWKRTVKLSHWEYDSYKPVLGQEPSEWMKCLHYHYSVSSFSPTSRGKRKKAFVHVVFIWRILPFFKCFHLSSRRCYIMYWCADILGIFFFNKTIFHYEFVLCVSTFFFFLV